MAAFFGSIRLRPMSGRSGCRDSSSETAIARLLPLGPHHGFWTVPPSFLRVLVGNSPAMAPPAGKADVRLRPTPTPFPERTGAHSDPLTAQPRPGRPPTRDGSSL